MRKKTTTITTTVLESYEEIFAYINKNPNIIANFDEVFTVEEEINEDEKVLLLESVPNIEFFINPQSEDLEENEAFILKELAKFPEIEKVYLMVDEEFDYYFIHKSNKIAQRHVITISYRSRPEVPVNY
jgi:hypothetical protein